MAANEGTDRFRSGLPDSATDENKRDFVAFRLDVYKKESQWRNDTPSEYFADYFRDFDVSDFKMIDSDDRRKLRDILRSRRVYVAKGRSILISDALYSVVEKDTPWPPDEARDEVERTDRDVERPRNGDTTVTDKDVPSGEMNKGHDEKGSNRGDADSSSAQFRRGSLLNLFKAYKIDAERYSGGTTDNFEWKFVLLLERCDQADVNVQDRARAFSIMLTGNARQFYLDSLRDKNHDLDELVHTIKDRFQTPERTRALLREWDNTSLKQSLPPMQASHRPNVWS